MANTVGGAQGGTMARSFGGKTLLVTGATGFIGRHLVERLRAVRGVRLVLLSRRPVAHLSRDPVTWVTANLLSLTPATWSAAGADRIDFVFHLGCFTPKRAAGAVDTERILHDNVQGTWALLNSLPAAPERVVLASTLDVYAPPCAGTVLTEQTPCDPVTAYGTSKLLCEQMAHAHAQAHGYGLAVVRYGHIFGPGEEAYRKIIPETIRRLLQGQAPIVYGDGAERDYLYVTDAVEATIRAARSEVHELGPVNVVRGESWPVRRVVETLAAAAGFTGPIRYLDGRSAGHALRFDNTRMRELLGTWPLVPMEEGLRREVQWFRRAVLARSA
jgi:nucleoside-diphosphate-sugar epimerase